LLKDRLDITPYPTMDEACEAAVKAAQESNMGAAS